MIDELFDKMYWGDRIDLNRWGSECRRGIQYHQISDFEASGPGAIRKISTGRKARGMASDDYRPPLLQE
jgi:coproporphyrinogen III oxidase-like Fe-S oxidoreductase